MFEAYMEKRSIKVVLINRFRCEKDNGVGQMTGSDTYDHFSRDLLLPKLISGELDMSELE